MTLAPWPGCLSCLVLFVLRHCVRGTARLALMRVEEQWMVVTCISFAKQFLFLLLSQKLGCQLTQECHGCSLCCCLRSVWILRVWLTLSSGSHACPGTTFESERLCELISEAERAFGQSSVLINLVISQVHV